MTNAKANSRFGLLKDAFASAGEDRNVRVTAYSTRPDLYVSFDLSLKTAEQLGKHLLKYVKERRESRERLHKAMQESQEGKAEK